MDNCCLKAHPLTVDFGRVPIQEGHAGVENLSFMRKENNMPSSKHNSNDQKLGGFRSNGGLGSGDGGNRTHDKGSAHAAASNEVCDTGRNEDERNHGESGQHSNGSGQENQNQETNAESGTTRGSSSERHVDTRKIGAGSNHSGVGHLPSGEENQRTNRETGSTRGGSFEHYAEG